MDYFDLLHQAQINNKNVSGQDTRCYKTTFTAPKKLEKSRVSSDNIKKFLARKEQEEEKKILQAKKKKEELLALRALDKKSQKRVQVMLKRTKSANKSVMEDAIDNYNTQDTLAGPQQCDDDDYGYVSQEASAFYEKLMAKYKNGPIESVKQMSREVKDLKAAKDRVKKALDKEAEELLHPTRKRKRKHNDASLADDVAENENDAPVKSQEMIKLEEVKEKPKKIPKKVPPPVDFFELMKIAAKKQHEPIIIEKKVEEPERPMTMKEKLELEREKERKNKKNSKPVDKCSESIKNVTSKHSAKNNNKSDKDVDKECESSKSFKSIIKSKSDINSNSIKAQSITKKEVKFGQVEKALLPNIKGSSSSNLKDKTSGSVDSKHFNCSSKNTFPTSKPVSNDQQVEKPKSKVDISDIDKEIEMLMKKKQLMLEAAKASKVNSKPCSSIQSNKEVSKRTQDFNSRGANNSKSGTSLPLKKSDLKNVPTKEELMRDKLTSKNGNDRDRLLGKNMNDRERLQSKSSYEKDKMSLKAVKSLDSRHSSSTLQKKFSPPRYGPPTRLPSQMIKKTHKRVIDSESEYDSDMDDFIDDGPDESMDYSRHIKEIFGYDKSRYSHIDEDECEESSFKTQMIEERRSARIGLLEDLEDIQREKEEKARAKKKMIRR